jgi:RNA recognition motif-containing protein
LNNKKTGCLVEFENEEDAEEALSLKGTIIRSFYINIVMSNAVIHLAPPKWMDCDRFLTKEERIRQTIYVTELDPMLIENQIQEVFGYCGKIKNFQLKKENGKFAWLKVEYDDLIAAQCALSMTNFQLGNKKLQIGKSMTLIEK